MVYHRRQITCKWIVKCLNTGKKWDMSFMQCIQSFLVLFVGAEWFLAKKVLQPNQIDKYIEESGYVYVCGTI